jgi:Putative zinc-finger
MTNCWSEGALRAYLDRELSAADMKAVAAHLGECSACDALCTELAGRAARVFALLEALPEPKVVTMRPAPSRAPSRWLWPGAAVALAAGLAIASIVVSHREDPAPVAVQKVPPPQLQPDPVEPMPTGRILPVATAPAARPAVAKVLRRKPASSPEMDYFVALDDQPIESGVIMRMAIQPGNAQADIVFDPAGRARAIRLVNNR